MKIKRDNKEFIFAILGVLLFASLFSSFYNSDNLEITFQKELEASSPTAQVVAFQRAIKVNSNIFSQYQKPSGSFVDAINRDNNEKIDFLKMYNQKNGISMNKEFVQALKKN